MGTRSPVVVAMLVVAAPPLALTVSTAAVMNRGQVPPSVQAGELRITVDGIRSAHGTVLIGLYDSPASFGRAVEASAKEGFLIDPDRFAAAPAGQRGAEERRGLQQSRAGTVRRHRLPRRERRRQARQELPGRSTEPYGFSNAQGFLGPPTFEDAAMALGDSNEAIRITLVYHQGSK